jgi:hypothetical protein
MNPRQYLVLFFIFLFSRNIAQNNKQLNVNTAPLFPLSLSNEYKAGSLAGDSTMVVVYFKHSYRSLNFTIRGGSKITEIEVSNEEAD